MIRTQRAQGDHGAVLVVVAITMTALMSMAAFAVNLGSISLKRRDLQADADAIALDLSRSLPPGADWAQQIIDSRNRNDFPASGTETDGIRDLLVEPGCFVQATYTFTTCAVAVADAVKVTAIDDVSEFFRFTNGTTSRSAIGRAGEEELAGFTIGSFAARLATANSPLLNSILTESLGFDPITAGLLGYDGLATAAVSLPLLATELGLGALTPDALLASSVTIEDLIEATADVLQTSGGTAAQVALLNALFANVDNPATTILIGDLIGLDTTGGAGTDAFVNVLDIVTGAASVANGSTALTIPSLGVNLPGVLDSEVSLDLIEGPRRYRGPEGTSGSTAQLRIPVNVVVAGGVTVDLEIEGAGAAGTIADITCDAAGRHLDIDVTPTLYDVTTGSVEVRLGDVPGIGTLLLALSLATGGVVGANTTLIASVDTSPGTGPPFVALFDVPPDVLDESGVDRTLVTVRSTPPGSLLLPTATTDIRLENVSGVPLAQFLVDAALLVVGVVVNPLLSTVLTQTNNLVLNPLMATLGVNVAGADITATDITCGTNGSPLLVG